MNRENILAVADAIEKHSIPDLGFNMDYLRASFTGIGKLDRSGNSCGTVACIAGWTVALFGNAYGGFSEARKILGLVDDEGHALFYANDRDELNDITPSQAVSVLRHLAETGEVDWDRALAEPSK